MSDLARTGTSVPEIEAQGLMLIGDPHVAAVPPMQRLEGYEDQVMDKIAACLEGAKRLDLVPFFLGDLFHWPRENPNSLLVRLIDLFHPHQPFVLVGNHDKYQARFTSDVSMAVLEAAGACRVVKNEGSVFVIQNDIQRTLVGATPDGYPLPSGYQGDRMDAEFVVWLTHHNAAFSEFKDRRYQIKELPGIDHLINGHIHRPQPHVQAGSTVWFNPGNLTRLTFSRRTKEREPAAHIWRPGKPELERFPVPYLPFEEVYPDQEFPPEEVEKEGGSEFVKGLERLAWRRTTEGTGLKQFLDENLDPEKPETELIRQLYREVTDDGKQS